MPERTESEVRVGPAGWSYPDWDGIVYPSPRERSFDPLAYLASYFDLVEVNSTFYRTPSRSACARWADRTEGNPGFVFTVKAPQELTHRGEPASEGQVAAFKKAIEPLAERGRLGAVLIQFPWSFRASSEETAYVRALTRWFDPLPAAVEVRHGTWGTPRALSFFRETGITLCGIDQPAVGYSLAPSAGAPNAERAYFRLHGRNKENWFKRDAGRDAKYDYTYGIRELEYWRDLVRQTRGSSRQVFVVLNNHFRGQAFLNALQLKAMLTGESAAAPDTLVSAYPAAGDLLRAPEVPKARSPRRRSPARKTQLELFGTQEEDGGKRRDRSGRDE